MKIRSLRPDSSGSSGDSLLHARDVDVARGSTLVLQHVSVEIFRSDVVRVSGTNGTGKTTLLETLCGLHAPRTGGISRSGRWVYLPTNVALMASMRCGEWLTVMRSLRGLDRIDWADRLEAGGLGGDVLRQPVRSLSVGMLQRLALTETFAAHADMLVFDEPFGNLDEAGRNWLTTELCLRASSSAIVLVDHSGTFVHRLRPTLNVDLAHRTATAIRTSPPR